MRHVIARSLPDTAALLSNPYKLFPQAPETRLVEHRMIHDILLDHPKNVKAASP
jgi:hypothetical protein